MSTRALVVDDEQHLRAVIAFTLESQGFIVDTANDADQAWSRLITAAYDVIVLDIVMPGRTGVSLCERIRETSDVPILLLTALSEPEHRVRGLEAGADDYLAKPFHPRELALRVQGLVRRHRREVSAVIANGPLTLDPADRRVTYYGEELHLSESEFRLLSAMVAQPGHTIGYAELAASVWHSAEAVAAKEMLKTAIWRLRWKLTQVHAGPLIENVRGVGYQMLRLTAPPEPTPSSGRD